MDFKDWTAGPDDDGRRLDRIAKALLPARTQGQVYAALRKGLIKHNGKKAPAGTIVRNGDTVGVAAFLLRTDAPPEAGDDALPRSGRPALTEVFRNEHILIVAKPSGMAVQPSARDKDTLSRIIRETEGNSSSLSFVPAPLHRLDRFTSGLLAVSQSLEGARTFSRLVREHRIGKTYVGVATGTLMHQERWRDFLDASAAAPPLYTVTVTDRPGPGAEEALTLARPLAQANGLSLVQYDIATGRKHQIRAQSAHHGHALAGDTAYGAPEADGLPGGRFLLHAARLSFPEDNGIGLPPGITCPVPEHFENFLKKNLLNWDGKLIL